MNEQMQILLQIVKLSNISRLIQGSYVAILMFQNVSFYCDCSI